MKRVIKSSDEPLSAINASKEMSRGVFWVIDGKLLAFPFIEDAEYGVAKSGTTYNHKKLWDHIKPKKCNKPFDYYPRGRVEFNGKGKPIIYMNPNIDESVVHEIKAEFGLRDEPIIHYDSSKHYRCHLDDGYTPQ